MKQFRSFFFFPFLIISFFYLTGCGGGGTNLPNTDAGNIPDWYLKKPEDPNYLYQSATDVSQDMQTSVDKAMASCRSQLTLEIQTRMDALVKKFAEEIGQGENSTFLSQFTNTTKQVASNTISGAKEKKKQVTREGNKFRAYVLLEYPIGAANKALMDALKKNEEAVTRFRSSQSYEELEREVEKLNKQ